VRRLLKRVVHIVVVVVIVDTEPVSNALVAFACRACVDRVVL
jgi:hypothetical protein